jgi:hypothetical protein
VCSHFTLPAALQATQPKDFSAIPCLCALQVLGAPVGVSTASHILVPNLPDPSIAG